MGNPEFTTDVSTERPATSSIIASYAPIIIPIILISLHSVAKLYLSEGNVMYPIITYLGWPVCALTVGVWLAYRNVHSIDDKKDSKSKWIETALKGSAMILVVTGLGGSLSEILKGTPVVDYMVNFFVYYKLPSIILPFLIGVIGNMITGSTTVGVITAASIVAPMLSNLNLSPEAAMLSGASGSVIIKYVNSSYFWVCTSLSRLTVNEGMLAYGGATLVGGLVTFFTVCILWGFGLV
jgi:GntP family gluconate:H+ symporter